MKRLCKNCHFWEELNIVEINNRGECRRYPSYLETPGSTWCGEWHAKDQYWYMKEDELKNDD